MLLVQQVSLGEQDHPVAAQGPDLFQGIPDARKRRGGILQDFAAGRQDASHHGARQPVPRQAHGGLQHRYQVRLGAIAQFFHVLRLGGIEFCREGFQRAVFLHLLGPLALRLAEKRLVLPEGIVGIEGDDLDRVAQLLHHRPAF